MEKELLNPCDPGQSLEIVDDDAGQFDAFGNYSALEIFNTLLNVYHKTKDPKYLNPVAYFKDKYEFYPHDPVPLERWLEDDFYFAHVGKTMYPKVKEDFFDIMARNPRPMRVVLKGSIGWGKTFLTTVIMARLLYELGCLRNPQAYYGLSPYSYITFMNMSLSGAHTRQVMFADLRNMIDGSPWFNTRFKRLKILKHTLLWPKKLISFVPGGSSELAALGQNLFGGVIEEANFFPVVKNSKKLRSTFEREWDQAKQLHDSVWRRMKSRYQRKGRVPGMLVLNSSANSIDDFLEKIVAEGDPNTIVIEHSEWETKPPSRYSGQKFYVFVGDQYRSPKILTNEEERQELERESPGNVYSVPVEYRLDFAKDLSGAIRDILGKHARPSNKFIVDVGKIYAMADESIPVPFADRYLEGIPARELSNAVRFHKFFNPIVNMRPEKQVLKMHPEAPRYCHVDLGVSGDSTGICVLHVGSVEEIRRRIESGDVVKEISPIFYVDFVAEIFPEPGGEVQIDEVRTLIIDLAQRVGFRFRKITFDSWQSFSTIQLLKKRFGDDVVGVIKVVSSKNSPWWTMRETLYEQRIRCYSYPPLFRQLSMLEFDQVTGHVDHPVGGHDDVAMAFSCAIYSALSEFDVGLRDAPQRGEGLVVESSEERWQREALEWLVDTPKKEEKKEDDFDEDFWDLSKYSEEDIERELRREG